MSQGAAARQQLLAQFSSAQIELLSIDVTDAASVRAAASAVSARCNDIIGMGAADGCRFGRLDVLYCNAGIMPTRGLDWGKVFHADFIATLASGGNARAMS